MTFTIRIEPRANVTPIEIKDNILGFSKSIDGKFVHTALTRPFVIDFPSFQHGFVKYGAKGSGKRPDYELQSVTIDWSEDAHKIRMSDGWKTIYIVPVISPEIPADRKQELRLPDYVAVALKDAYEEWERTTEAVNGMIPVIQHEIDEFGVHAFNILQYVPRPINRFGAPLVAQIIPFKPEPVIDPKTDKPTTKNEAMLEHLKAHLAKKHETAE